jgi:chitinase
MRHLTVFLLTLLCALLSFTASTYAATSKKIYGKHKLISYVIDWEVPKKINWSQLDHIAYSFAEPDKTGSLKSFTSSTLKSCT